MSTKPPTPSSPRIDFSERFTALIEEYNAGSRSIEELFEELLGLLGALDEEQERHVRENLTEEELVIFDILTRPSPALSAEERGEVKRVTRQLLTRLKELLVLNWRKKAAARSALKLAIEDTLDAGLPAKYSRVDFGQKCSAVFEHFYERYPERGQGIYAHVAQRRQRSAPCTAAQIQTLSPPPPSNPAYVHAG